MFRAAMTEFMNFCLPPGNKVCKSEQIISFSDNT